MIFIERLEKRRNGGEPSEGLLVFPICIGQANFMHALTDSHVGTCSRRSSGSRNRALADRYGNDMTPSDAAASRIGAGKTRAAHGSWSKTSVSRKMAHIAVSL